MRRFSSSRLDPNDSEDDSDEDADHGPVRKAMPVPPKDDDDYDDDDE